MNDCPSSHSWFKRCKFVARYDTKTPSKEDIKGIAFYLDVVDIINAMSAKIYVHDICLRCGKKISRDKEMLDV